MKFETMLVITFPFFMFSFFAFCAFIYYVDNFGCTP